MGKEKYMIGDVANLMGMSRDTLRYYEKRGLLSSEKGENGYRYYTDKEISRLVGILYQRKMNVSLEDMETLWSVDDSIANLTGIIENRLEEEELALRAHRQTIARLRLTHSDCQRIRGQLGDILLKDSPTARVIVPHCEYDESIGLWFRLAKEHPGLDMMYTFDEYTLAREHDALHLDYQNTQLILYDSLEDYVDYEIPLETPAARPVRCVYSFCASSTRIPQAAAILPMLDWAGQQGLPVSDRLFSTYAIQGLLDGQYTYYLELYLPLR